MSEKQARLAVHPLRDAAIIHRGLGECRELAALGIQGGIQFNNIHFARALFRSFLGPI